MRLRNLRDFFSGFRDLGPSARKVWAGTCLFGLLLSTCAATALADRQDLDEVRQQVKSYLVQHYTTPEIKKLTVEVKRLDPRLALASCEQPLSLEVNDRDNNGGNVTVMTRCRGDRPWSIYVPAKVDLYRPVVVAARNLTRGTVIAPSHIKMAARNTSLLRQGFADSPASVVGMELRRPIRADEALRSGVLIEPLAVERGDRVRLISETAGIRVKTSGTAMSSGRVGEQIRVKNSRSERIVTVEVVAPGEVKTVL